MSCGEGHNIYSENGWISVKWTYDDNSSWSLTRISDRFAPTMHCGQDYLHSCRGWEVDDKYYRCSNHTSKCDYDRSQEIQEIETTLKIQEIETTQIKPTLTITESISNFFATNIAPIVDIKCLCVVTLLSCVYCG